MITVCDEFTSDILGRWFNLSMIHHCQFLRRSLMRVNFQINHKPAQANAETYTPWLWVARDALGMITADASRRA